MKKLVVLLLSLVLVFSFAGCGGGSESEAPKATDSGELGEYAVTIKDYQLVKNYDGEDAIAITYDFTNNSSEATSFDVACMYTIFQDGIELEYTSVYIDEDSFTMMDENTMKEIQPGKTLEVTTTSKLNDLTNPVDVEVEEFLGSGDKLVKTFEIAQ